MRGRDFITGALSGVAAETIAELAQSGAETRAYKAAEKKAHQENRPLCKEDIQSALLDELDTAKDWGAFGSLALGAILGLDPHTVNDTVQNALSNNFRG